MDNPIGFNLAMRYDITNEESKVFLFLFLFLLLDLSMIPLVRLPI